jgi:transcriptional regulator with XRE-family HTH domain
MTQEELAGELDLSGSNISMIETGKQGYTQETLELLAGALKTDPASLLVRDPTDPDGIWAVWDRIPNNERGRAIGVLSAFAVPAADEIQPPAPRRAGAKRGQT